MKIGSDGGDSMLKFVTQQNSCLRNAVHTTPVVFHNFENYDAHLFIKQLYKYKYKYININITFFKKVLVHISQKNNQLELLKILMLILKLDFLIL